MCGVALTAPAAAQLGAPNIVWADAGSGPFFCAAYTRDGRYLVTGGERSIKLWDARTGQFVRSLISHNDNVYALATSPDGERLYSGGGYVGVFPNDIAIREWRTADWTLARTLASHHLIVSSLDVSDDGAWLAVSQRDDSTPSQGCAFYRLVPPDNFGERIFDHFHYFKRSIAMMPGSATAVVMDTPTRPAIVGVPAATRVRAIAAPSDSGGTFALSPDGTRLALESGPRFHVLDMTAVDTPVIFTSDPHPGEIVSLVFSDDGARLAAASVDFGGTGNALRMYSTADWTHPWGEALALGATLPGEIAFSPDGDRVALVAGERPDYGNGRNGVRVHRTADGAELHRLSGPLLSNVRDTRFSPDGRIVAAVSLDAAVSLWSVATGRLVTRLIAADELASISFDFMPDGEHIATMRYDKTPGSHPVTVRRIADGAVVRQFEGHGGGWIACAPNGRWIAVPGPGNQSVRILDAETGATVRLMPGTGRAIFSGDAGLIAFMASGARLEVRRTTDWSLAHTLEDAGADLLDLSRDGSMVVTRAQGVIRVRRVADGQLVLQTPSAAHDASFTPDGAHLVTAGVGAQVWSLSSGKLVDTLTAEMAPRVLALAASPHGRYLAAGRTDATLVLARNPASCDADFDDNGAATSADVMAFLDAFFLEQPVADINFDDAVNSQDFFDFLAAFFAGCP